jgi:hypothetical protein
MELSCDAPNRAKFRQDACPVGPIAPTPHARTRRFDFHRLGPETDCGCAEPTHTLIGSFGSIRSLRLKQGVE